MFKKYLPWVLELLIISACVKQLPEAPNKKNGWQRDNLKGNVKIVTSSTHKAVESFDKVYGGFSI